MSVLRFPGLGQITAACGRICWSKLVIHTKSKQQEHESKGSLQLFCVSTGFCVACVCFLLMYLFLPDDSPNQKTDEISVFTPNQPIAVLCSFLLGFSDCLFQTEIFSFIGSNFKVSFCHPYRYFALSRKSSCS